MQAQSNLRRARRSIRGTGAVRYCAILTTAAFGLLPTAARAVTYQWNRNAGGAYVWSNSSNWSGNGVPNDPTALVTFEDGSNLTGAQIIQVDNSQSCGELLLGDLGGVYQQTLFNNTGHLGLGVSGGTALLYPDGGNSDPTITIPIQLNNCNLLIESYYQSLSGNTNPNNPNSENISTYGISGGLNLEVKHAVVDFTNAISYSGAMTLDGGYAKVTLNSGSTLPSTTSVSLADTTDSLDVGTTAQTIQSISGIGAVNTTTGGSITLTNDNGTFAGHLTGNGTVHIAGASGMTLTGANDAAIQGFNGFYGNILVAPSGTSFAASLSVPNDNALGNVGATVELEQGILATTGTFALAQQLTIPSSYVGTLAPAASTTLTANGLITGGGFLVVDGLGTLVLTNSNNAFNGMRLTHGLVQFSTDHQLGTPGAAITFAGGSLELLASNTVSMNRPMTLSEVGSITVDSGSTLTQAGVLSEVPSAPEFPNHAILTVNGAGTLVLTGTNSYTGGTVINGNLSVSRDENLGSTDTPLQPITFGSHLVRSGSFTFTFPGNLITTGNFTTNRPVVLGSQGGALTPSAGTNVVFNGVVSGGASGHGLSVAGPGSIQLLQPNTFIGGVSITAGGTARVTQDSNLGDSSNSVELNNGTLAWQSGGSSSTSRAIQIDGNGGTISAAAISSVVNLNGPITGNGALAATGFGNINVRAGNNSYSGGTSIASGLTVGVGPFPYQTTSPLGSGPVTLAGGLSLHGTGGITTGHQQTLNVAGFNQDVVVDRQADVSNYRSTVTSAFDNYPSTTSGYALFENGYPSSTGGLPQNHTVLSENGSGVTFQLQPYAASNVLLLPSQGLSGVLTLATPGTFTKLSFLAASANGNAATSETLNFTDGTSLVVTPVVEDWYAHTAAALTLNNRLNLANGGIDTSNPGYPRLFEYDITVPAPLTSKFLSGVTFLNTGSTGSLGVFALSGNGSLLGANQVYGNNAVAVTADSSISVDGSPHATMGPLTIASNTLSVHARQGSSLGFAGATLTGNATFNVDVGVVLDLGTTTGSGGAGGFSEIGAGFVQFAPGGRLGFLNIGSEMALTSSRSHLEVGSLTITGYGSRLDVGNNDLIIHSGSLATVRSELQDGYHGGNWVGINGIISTAAFSDQTKSLGYGVLSGVFDGVTVGSGDIVVKYTVAGDANLDGTVDFNDLVALAQNYGAPGGNLNWQQGDFNYDGVTDFNDLVIIAQRYGQGLSPSVIASLGSSAFASDWALAQSLVAPEPTSLAALGGLLTIFVRRRRA